MKSELIAKAGCALSKLGMRAKKHSPEIMIVAGIAGMVTAAVMACKASTKVESVVADTKEKLNAVKKVEAQKREDYSSEDAKKDRIIIYRDASWEFIKLYGPAIALGMTSIASILLGHRTIKKRSAALAAAFAATDKTFSEYRKRVAERLGDEEEKAIRYGLKAKEITETKINDAGEEETVKRVVQVSENPLISQYARFFDDSSILWTKNPETNLMTLRQIQDDINLKFRTRKHVFLNEVYRKLDIPETEIGQRVGWFWDPDDPDSQYIDFGIYGMNKEKRKFVNGYEQCVLLDFNVHGDITDKVWPKRKAL